MDKDFNEKALHVSNGEEKSKKKRFFTVFFIMLAIFMLPFLTVLTTVFLLPPVYKDTFVGELGEKFDLLCETDEPKVVVIGGSSVAFGLDSEMLEEALGMKVVNFGLYADLGTKLMMDLSKANINEGDIIVLAPEMNSQTLSLYFNSETASEALDGSMKMRLYVGSDDRDSLIGASWKFTCNKLKYLITGTRPENSGAYKKENFNEYGDNIYDRPFNEMTGVQNRISFSFRTNSADGVVTDYERYVEYVNDYVKFAKKRGASVYFSFPPMDKDAISSSVTDESIRNFYRNLLISLDCTVISNVNDYIMDDGYFYDSEFHLNNAGVVLRTVLLADDIKRQLGDTSLTLSADLIPEPTGKRPFSPYFELRNIDRKDGWRIVGLTEEGKKAESLTVPDSINDIPIISIASGAFDGAESLTMLTLGANVSELEAGVFRGASKLSFVILSEGRDASSVSVPETGLTDGCGEAMKIYADWRYADTFENTGNWKNYVGLVKPEMNFELEKVSDTGGDYWTVIGVNESGTLRSELKIPDQYEGLPIKSIRAGAFTDADKLVTLNIGANIEKIEARAFEGAGELRRINIPATLSADKLLLPQSSAELLYGTSDMKIYVDYTVYEGYVYSASYSDYQSVLDSENRYFNLTKGSTGWSIVGLNTIGAKMTEFTIPDTVNGIPINRICENAFSGNTTLVKLTVGKNISGIDGGAFRGSAIVNLTVPNEIDPTQISVPNNMSGTLMTDGAASSLKIYVNPKYYEACLSDYFWGDYGTYITKNQ